MTNNIKQHSQEWYEAKQSKVGGSEIFSLCLEYCKKELAQIGIENETSFKTALEIYLEKKFDVKSDPISQVCSEYGLGMENYIINRLNSENPNFVATGSKDFIINEEIHPLAACSPDGSVEPSQPFLDYDKKQVGKSEGMLEVKTTQFTYNYEAEAGAKWQYLFQLNYNMLVCGNEWGLLACLTPKEKEFDTDFFKGKVLGELKLATYLKENTYNIYEIIDSTYNLYTYTYKANRTIQSICKLALERFQKALDNVILPTLSDNESKLMREKKMLAKMYPAKYGTIEADKQLNELLDERGIVNNEFKKLKTEFEQLNCKIIQKMDKAIEAEGVNYKAKFDKRHALRVSQNKDSDVTPKMVEQLQSGEFVDLTQGG